MIGHVIIVINGDTKEFFVAPEHDDYDLDGFVPITIRMREWETIESIIKAYEDDGYKNINLFDLYPEKE